MWVIDNFPYTTGVDENMTKPHCWKCVTVNHCWFKNEADKKPLPFEYVKYSNQELLKISKGLYHPNCHCKEIGVDSPFVEEIKLVYIEGKVNWLFSDKIGWLNAMGYGAENRDEVMKILATALKKAYSDGNYVFRGHNKFGFLINLYFDFPGGNEKSGHIYKLKSGVIIFSDKKIKINTFIGGWQENESL